MDIIGQEWADKRVYPPHSPLLSREPCPICGHPTMDCTVDVHSTTIPVATPTSEEDISS